MSRRKEYKTCGRNVKIRFLRVWENKISLFSSSPREKICVNHFYSNYTATSSKYSYDYNFNFTFCVTHFCFIYVCIWNGYKLLSDIFLCSTIRENQVTWIRDMLSTSGIYPLSRSQIDLIENSPRSTFDHDCTVPYTSSGSLILQTRRRRRKHLWIFEQVDKSGQNRLYTFDNANDRRLTHIFVHY